MFTLVRAWTDLTDDEFFWEPFPGCWSVRRRVQCQTPTPFGQGEWAVDFDAGLSVAAGRGETAEPMTTIAWLLWHVASMPGRAVELDFLGGHKSADSGWTSPYIAEHPVFISARDAVETMTDGWRALDRALQTSNDEQLERRTHFWGYPGHPGPPAYGYQILASILNEVSHHGTQVCMLRDLYLASGGRVLMSSLE
ncbi:MAG TPA: DinB family protein [Acidimicrobiales bacterium]|nr:DinB family protein [Acidimicrobiales bacterium]